MKLHFIPVGKPAPATQTTFFDLLDYVGRCHLEGFFYRPVAAIFTVHFIALYARYIDVL
jgi:hypothetical protein